MTKGASHSPPMNYLRHWAQVASFSEDSRKDRAMKTAPGLLGHHDELSWHLLPIPLVLPARLYRRDAHLKAVAHFSSHTIIMSAKSRLHSGVAGAFRVTFPWEATPLASISPHPPVIWWQVCTGCVSRSSCNARGISICTTHVFLTM
jgi:hypothetical protein